MTLSTRNHHKTNAYSQMSNAGQRTYRTLCGWGIILLPRYPRNSRFVPAWCHCCCNHSGRLRLSCWRPCSSAWPICIIWLSACDPEWSWKRRWLCQVFADKSIRYPHRSNSIFVYICSVSIGLHRHIWHVFGIFVCKDWPLYCTVCGACILQSHGLPWYSGSAGADTEEKVFVHRVLCNWSHWLDRSVAHCDRAEMVPQRFVLDQRLIFNQNIAILI